MNNVIKKHDQDNSTEVHYVTQSLAKNLYDICYSIINISEIPFQISTTYVISILNERENNCRKILNGLLNISFKKSKYEKAEFSNVNGTKKKLQMKCYVKTTLILNGMNGR